MIAWIFWICAIFAIFSALLTSYLKYGEKVWVVNKRQTIIIGGLVVFVVSVIGLVYILLFTNYKSLEENQTWMPLLWISVFFIFIGAMIASFSVKAEKIGLLKKDLALKWFRIGYAIITVGSVLLLYTFLPGNLVSNI